MLRKDPSRAAQFDEVYGAGASSQYLPSATPPTTTLATRSSYPGHTVPTQQRTEWVPDDAADACIACGDTFGVFTRKHHW